MTVKQYLTLGISSLVLASVLAALVYLVRQRQQIVSRAVPATTLSFTPSDSSPLVGQTFTVGVTINTGSNTVSAAELHLVYSGSAIVAQNISAGSFFTNPAVIGAQVGAGTADITLLGGVGGAKQGTGTLATVTFRAVNPGSSVINMAQTTAISGIGEGAQNVFVGATPTTITVRSGVGPTATSTPSPPRRDDEDDEDDDDDGPRRPTPTPTRRPSPTPTRTPTPTPTTRPSPTPTPTQPAQGGGPTPTSTPTPTPTQSSANPTATPTVRPTATPTQLAQGGGPVSTPTPTVSAEQLPVSGFPLPTMALLLLGGLVIIGSWSFLLFASRE